MSFIDREHEWGGTVTCSSGSFGSLRLVFALLLALHFLTLLLLWIHGGRHGSDNIFLVQRLSGGLRMREVRSFNRLRLAP
jgi:hypothetical protein